MATNPFDSIVGLKGITPESPAPSIWINDLPGMSTELVAAVADDEDEATGDTDGSITTYARIRRLALEKLRGLLEGELSKSADFQYTGDKTGELTGESSDVILLPAAVYAGYSVVVPVKSTDEFYIKRLSLDSASEESVDTIIKVFSATGKELFTKDVTVEPNYNEIDIDFAVRSQFGRNVILFIGIDVSELSLRTLGTSQGFGCGSMDSVTMPVSSAHNIGSQSNAVSTGIMLNAVIRRSLIDVIAMQADRFAWAYANIVGSCLMTEKMASTNVNLFTNTNRLFTEELETRLMDEAKKIVCPIARDIIKTYRSTPVMQADSEFQGGYFEGGFV